ncbi:MAG: hypothetical protein Q8T09_22565 [Candidatus Melainabacteria bacterium]|nr:hypothetical protein [Candidatus Melainabacteria bacterium]
MIAQISKYSDEQILAAAKCLITPHQANRLTKAASQMLPISAVLTLTVLAERDYDNLVAEVSHNNLKETAVERALATMAQFESAEERQSTHEDGYAQKCPQSCSQEGARSHAIFCQESAIDENELLSKLQSLFGMPIPQPFNA